MGTLGDNIKNRREQLSLTQDELALKMGYSSRSTVNKIEKGINDITQSKIAAFARALDTTPAHLMGWDKEKAYKSGEEAGILVKKYRKLTDANKQAVMIIIDNLLGTQSEM